MTGKHAVLSGNPGTCHIGSERRVMSDITQPWLLWLKGALFVVVGVAAGVYVLAALPRWDIALCLGIAIWAFARVYYFAFYVIEKYIDPSFRFAGLWSVIRYALGRGRGGSGHARETAR